LKTTDAQRRGNFFLVWTEKGKKRESKVKDRTFESAIKAARTKERHLEDSADGFKRPDPLHPNDRKTIADSIERYLQRVETSQDPQTLKAYRQSLRQFQRWTTLTYMDEIDHEHVMAFRKNAESKGTPDSPLIGKRCALTSSSKSPWGWRMARVRSRSQIWGR
jgi:hypothetical protein